MKILVLKFPASMYFEVERKMSHQVKAGEDEQPAGDTAGQRSTVCRTFCNDGNSLHATQYGRRVWISNTENVASAIEELDFSLFN